VTAPAIASHIRQPRSRWAVPAAILFAALVMVFYGAVWKDAPFHATDTPEYLAAARAIATGHFEIQQPRTPGLPLFVLLAGTGRGYFLLSLALHLAAVGLLAWVLAAMGVNGALIALFAAIAVLPSFVQKDAYILSEGLFEFLVAAGFAGLWPGRRAPWRLALSGTAFALATLTRPQNQLLPLVLMALLAVYFGRRGVRMAAWLMAPYCLIVGGVMANNFVRFHDPGLTYTVGFHLGTRTVTLYEDIPDRQLRDVLVATRNAAYGHPNRNIYWTSLYTRDELGRMKGMTRQQLARYERDVFLRLILGHPLAYLEEVGRGFVHFWFPDLSKQTNQGRALRAVSMAAQVGLAYVFWPVFVVWAGLGLGRRALPVPEWLENTAQRFIFAAGMATILYTAAICCLFDMGEPRYRTTVDLEILFVAVVAGDFLWKARRAGTAIARR